MMSSEDKMIQHLEVLRADVRDEVKKRIEQRDKYSIQLTVALTAVVAFSFSKPEFQKALVAAPLVSIYFVTLILYSYRVHSVLARYLREEIEPELAKLCGTCPQLEWETFYSQHQVPGIRRCFFLVTLWVVLLLALGYLYVTVPCSDAFWIPLVVLGITYIIGAGAITWVFRKE